MNNQRNKLTPNSKRPKNLPQKTAEHFSGQSSEWQPKVFIKTFGCQMNSRDSEALAGLLRDAGFIMSDSPDDADVILFNTCSIRQHAEDKVWSEIGRIAPSKFAKANLNRGGNHANKKIVGVIGCMAENYKENIFRRAPLVDLVAGPNDLSKVPHLIKQVIKQRSHALAVATKIREEDFYISDFREKKDHAYVVISEGCNNFCSYCVVPYVRGRLHCRNLRDILDEIKHTVDSGIKNITLLGQNVNSYKFKNAGFVKLVEAVNEINGLEQFDFVTSHPKDTDENLFFAMRDLEKCKKALHLPVQSGSDRILKLMNRGYTQTHYRNLIEKYHNIVGGKLSTDIIVGFPGETEKDFRETLNLVKDIEFNSAYIFKYSPRPNTKAQDLTDSVPKKEKERRHKLILDLQKEISKIKNLFDNAIGI